MEACGFDELMEEVLPVPHAVIAANAPSRIAENEILTVIPEGSVNIAYAFLKALTALAKLASLYNDLVLRTPGVNGDCRTTKQSYSVPVFCTADMQFRPFRGPNIWRVAFGILGSV
jgi:hypothetical protein